MQTVLPQALLASAAYIWVFTLSSLHNCTLHMPDTAAAAATVASRLGCPTLSYIRWEELACHSLPTHSGAADVLQD